MSAKAEVLRFGGQIAGLGTGSGVRVVVGRWAETPWGDFADVMIEQPEGHRVLLAPDQRVAELLQQTYTFDEVVIGPVSVVDDDGGWRVSGPELSLQIELGPRALLGRLLRLVPRPIATAPWWLTMINPVAQMIMKGVRTRGTAGSGRTEFYGAYDLHGLVSAGGSWRDVDLGALAPVDPPVRFGFGSSPRTPSVTKLVTTIRVPRH